MLFPTLPGASEIDLKPDSKQNETTGNAMYVAHLNVLGIFISTLLNSLLVRKQKLSAGIHVKI